MQVDIDQQCMQIIAKRQPTAIDLRMVLTVVKIVNELERARRRDQEDRVQGAADAAPRAAVERALSRDHARGGTRGGTTCSLRSTRLRASTSRRQRRWSSNDEAIDFAFLSILRQLISYMMEDPRTITPALEIVFIAKSIERVGDHAKNIAENVVHVVKGKDVRHATAEQIRAEVAE